MHCLILVTLLAASAFAGDQLSSVSDRVGSGSGTAFTLQGEGRITAVRLWENSNRVYGIQLRYGFIWSKIGGLSSGHRHTFELREKEVIVEVSGKWGHYIQWILFVTNQGRFIMVGGPSGQSYNMYPLHPKAELCSISGSYHGGLTGFSAHWNVIPDHTDHNNDGEFR